MREIILDVIIWLTITGAVISLVIGILLFFNSRILSTLNKSLNKWYSSRKTLKPLEIMHETDNYFYQNNKLFGWIFLIGSLVGLYLLVAQYPIGAFGSTQAVNVWGVILEILFWSLRIFFIIFMFFGLAVWILLIYSPEKLRTSSQFLNRWLSTRLLFLPLEKSYGSFDNYVIRHYRLFGAFFVIGSLIIIITITLQIQ